MASNNSRTQPMLLFLPDISGFSKFVNNTEIDHSQHIIEELLEILIDANEINLEVSEIEGDAILFYKTGAPGNFDKLLAQVESMYLKFHTHLKMYEHTRICQCGACSTANDLKLKFIITYGEVGFNKIKDHYKLFGKEVIIAHRLLKNKVSHDEYVLITKEAMDGHDADVDLSGWGKFEKVTEEYDIGTIKYHYNLLDSISQNIPSPKIESYGLNESKKLVLESSLEIESPIDLVFNVLSDYSIRHLWSVGIKGSDQLNGKISKNGSTHRCLINDNASDPFFVAHNFNATKDYIVFTETDYDKKVSVVFTLKKLSTNTTLLKTHTFLDVGILKLTLFSLLLKKKFMKNAKESYANLDRYCKILTESGKLPQAQIVL